MGLKKRLMKMVGRTVMQDQIFQTWSSSERMSQIYRL